MRRKESGESMKTFVGRIHVGAGTQIGPLTTFPVWMADLHGAALDVPPRARLEVAELDEPRIDALTVSSQGDAPVLLTEGTLLRGGMQTRVLARDAVVLPGRRVEVETTCVEAGRWGGGTEHAVHERAPLRVLGELRGVRVDRRRRADRGDRQSRVWSSVQSYEVHYGQRPTSSLVEMMEDRHDARPVRRRVETIRRLLDEQIRTVMPGQCGIIIGVGGHPVMLETFGRHDTFTLMLPLMINALALDGALYQDEPTPARRAVRFAQILQETAMQRATRISEGQIYGATNEVLDVRALETSFTSGVAHLLAINTRHQLVRAA